MADELDNIFAALSACVGWLHESDVPHIVIGGVAYGLVADPRATTDVDWTIWAEDESWPRLLEIAKKYNIAPRENNVLKFAEAHRVLKLVHIPSSTSIDVACATTPFEEQAVRAGREKLFRGLLVRVPRPEDLIIMKMIAHRPQDLIDVDNIFTFNENLDFRFIRKWVREYAALMDSPGILSDLDRIRRKKPLGKSLLRATRKKKRR